MDIFGDHSLFQNLNRTATFIGNKTLAKQLLQLASTEIILDNQEAIKELSGKLDLALKNYELAYSLIEQNPLIVRLKEKIETLKNISPK